MIPPMKPAKQDNRLIVLKIRDALDGFNELTQQEAEALVGRTVTVTYGETSVTVPIVSVWDFFNAMQQHYSWLYTYAIADKSSWEDWNASAKLTALANLWSWFWSRKQRAIEQWIIDVYIKLDPLVTGWEKVDGSKTFKDFGYTDTYNKYVVSNSRNGHYKEITFGGAGHEVTIGSTQNDDLKNTLISNAASTSTSKMAGGVATDASASDQGVVTRGSLGTGDTPTTKVWQGTFQSTALTAELPEINEQQNTGETASRSSTGSADSSKAEGSILHDNADVGSIDHDQHGEALSNTNKEANTGDIIAKMAEYIKFDVTKAVLKEFFDEATFYVDCYQNDDWGGTLWL